MHNHSLKHFDTAVELISRYNGKEPLQYYLKKYFAINKKHGSRDRKYITHCCYTFYRIGNNLPELPLAERLKIALFISNDTAGPFESILPAEWLKNSRSDLQNRIAFIKKIYQRFDEENIFPFAAYLSEDIDNTLFQLSFLQQPQLFIRIRPGKKSSVISKLNQAGIPCNIINENTLSFTNTTKIETVIQLNEEAVIQDISSQKIGSFFQYVKDDYHKITPIKIWDACAASGGKSLLAKDVFGKADLTVSDIRPNILHNLKQRFKEASLRSYKTFMADLTCPVTLQNKYDLIICDAPCTGSGTWARTPESIAVFNAQEIEKFNALQKKIVTNCIPHLDEAGYFLYITCSVFEKENEDLINYIETESALKCIKKETITGYAQKGDSMFAALFSFPK